MTSVTEKMTWLQCPTTVVPFFGDQPFWGSHVHAKGVGPVPIPVNEFSLEKLVAAIHFMLDPEVCLGTTHPALLASLKPNMEKSGMQKNKRSLMDL
jgi:hypothetical protein